MTKTFTEIPSALPATALLDQVEYPSDLRKLTPEQLVPLADELREYLLYVVSNTGGHFGAGLGVVELTIALHYIFDTPKDRLVWDVGHQTYPHKILTGRRRQLGSMRQQGGISGFPKRSESEYDAFGVGHSSTSVSAALGMALAAQHRGDQRKHVAVIGDGAMTAGMAFEALNHCAESRADVLIVLNDNQMSISENVGGLSTYFSKIWSSRADNSVRAEGQRAPSQPAQAAELAPQTQEHIKNMASPGTLFEEMGFHYIGPIDGHDIASLVDTLRNLKSMSEPVLLHVGTQKGRGFEPAEKDPIKYHALDKIEPKQSIEQAPTKQNGPKFQAVFGQWLCDMAAVDADLVAITPAMCEGSGMSDFAKRFPDRYQDVGIAEQHAITLAGGLACEGLKPVVAIYSTFLQRGYDQLIHDVALQNLDVTFAIDRAGLVGEDGASHAGTFDLSYLRCIPNMLVLTPSDENETRQALYTAYMHRGPAAVRYPRGKGINAKIESAMTAMPIGKGVIRRSGKEIAIFAFGTLLHHCYLAAEQLDATLVDMRFAKPIDRALISELSANHSLIVTVEENALAGGAGSAVLEFAASQKLGCQFHTIGLADAFLDHGTRSQLFDDAGLSAEAILSKIKSLLD